MVEYYRVFLALHVISIISWMAGVLYLFRLFVYHAEEGETVVKARFVVMEERLSRIIVLPAMLAALVFGVIMLFLNPYLMTETWMRLKLFFVVCLMLVTHLGLHFRRELAAGSSKHGSRFFRIFNEVPTLLMIFIVFLVILKPFSS